MVSECRLGNGPERGLKTVSLNPYSPVIQVNSADSDQTPHCLPKNAAFDLCLQCLPMIQSRFYR